MEFRDYIASLRHRRPKGVDTQPTDPRYRRELRAVRLAFEADRDYERTIELASPFVRSTDPQLQTQAKRYVALSLFYLKRYAEACEIQLELVQAGDDVVDWTNVMTSATLAGNLELGKEAFERACEQTLTRSDRRTASVPHLQLWYASALGERQEYRSALPLIESLRKVYEELQITDSMFLHNRRVPSLQETMDVAVNVLVGLGDSFDPAAWIDAFASHLDDEGRHYLASIKQEIATAHKKSR